MRYCMNCGSMNDTDAKFCSGCGKKFEFASEDAKKSDYSTNPETEPNVSEDVSQEEPKNQYNEYNGQSDIYNNQINDHNPHINNNNRQPNVDYGQAMSIDKYKGYSVASLILGICSIVFCAFIPLIPLACAIVGLVLSNKLKKYGLSNMAKAGRILCIIGIILIAVIVVLFIIAVIALTTAIINNPGVINDLSDFYKFYGY